MHTHKNISDSLCSAHTPPASTRSYQTLKPPQPIQNEDNTHPKPHRQPLPSAGVGNLQEYSRSLPQQQQPRQQTRQPPQQQTRQQPQQQTRQAQQQTHQPPQPRQAPLQAPQQGEQSGQAPQQPPQQQASGPGRYGGGYGGAYRGGAPAYDPRMASNRRATDPGLCISSLAWWVTDRDLQTIFERFGELKSVKIYVDNNNGKSKGIAFIEYVDIRNVSRARETLNGTDILGKKCRIDQATSLAMNSMIRDQNRHDRLGPQRGGPWRGPPPPRWGPGPPPPNPYGGPPHWGAPAWRGGGAWERPGGHAYGGGGRHKELEAYAYDNGYRRHRDGPPRRGDRSPRDRRRSRSRSRSRSDGRGSAKRRRERSDRDRDRDRDRGDRDRDRDRDRDTEKRRRRRE